MTTENKIENLEEISTKLLDSVGRRIYYKAFNEQILSSSDYDTLIKLNLKRLNQGAEIEETNLKDATKSYVIRFIADKKKKFLDNLSEVMDVNFLGEKTTLLDTKFDIPEKFDDFDEEVVNLKFQSLFNLVKVYLFRRENIDPRDEQSLMKFEGKTLEKKIENFKKGSYIKIDQKVIEILIEDIWMKIKDHYIQIDENIARIKQWLRDYLEDIRGENLLSIHFYDFENDIVNMIIKNLIEEGEKIGMIMSTSGMQGFQQGVMKNFGDKTSNMFSNGEIPASFQNIQSLLDLRETPSCPRSIITFQNASIDHVYSRIRDIKVTKGSHIIKEFYFSTVLEIELDTAEMYLRRCGVNFFMSKLSEIYPEMVNYLVKFDGVDRITISGKNLDLGRQQEIRIRIMSAIFKGISVIDEVNLVCQNFNSAVKNVKENSKKKGEFKLTFSQFMMKKFSISVSDIKQHVNACLREVSRKASFEINEVEDGLLVKTYPGLNLNLILGRANYLNFSNYDFKIEDNKLIIPDSNQKRKEKFLFMLIDRKIINKKFEINKNWIEDLLLIQQEKESFDIDFDHEKDIYTLRSQSAIKEIKFKNDFKNVRVINDDTFNKYKKWFLVTNQIGTIKEYIQLLKIPGIDVNSTHCNNVHFINKIYGIDTAQAFLYHELVNQFGSDFYEEYSVIISRFMTSHGKLHGLKKSDFDDMDKLEGTSNSLMHETVYKTFAELAQLGRLITMFEEKTKLFIQNQ